MSKGGERVGMGFNPSGNPAVDQVKQSVAALIDDLDLYLVGNPEIDRCVSVAQTKLEDACMWAVKAITKS